MGKVSVSMLSADFSHLARSCNMVNESPAWGFHLDIMDGVFVPNISYGFPVIEAIAKHAKKPLDAHLMVVEPSRYYQRYKDSGIDWLTVHYEACPHLNRDLQEIRRLGMKAGIALNRYSCFPAGSGHILCRPCINHVCKPGFEVRLLLRAPMKKLSSLTACEMKNTWTFSYK